MFNLFIGGGSPQLYYHDCSGPKSQVTPVTRAPLVGFELATHGIQLYAIAILDKTSFNMIKEIMKERIYGKLVSNLP